MDIFQDENFSNEKRSGFFKKNKIFSFFVRLCIDVLIAFTEQAH